MSFTDFFSIFLQNSKPINDMSLTADEESPIQLLSLLNKCKVSESVILNSEGRWDSPFFSFLPCAVCYKAMVLEACLWAIVQSSVKYYSLFFRFNRIQNI